MIIVLYSYSKLREISLRNLRKDTVAMIEGVYKPRNLINNDFIECSRDFVSE